jgi:hypothetical protein
MLAQVGRAAQKIVVERDIAAETLTITVSAPLVLNWISPILSRLAAVMRTRPRHCVGLGIECAAVAADRQGAVRGLLAELIRQAGHAGGHQAAVLPEVAHERRVGGAQIGDHDVGIDVGVADRAAHLHGLGEPLRLNPLLTLPPTTRLHHC